MYSSNTNSVTVRKKHPWQDAVRKLNEERHSRENKEVSRHGNPLPPRPAAQTQSQSPSRRGESVRIVNYANLISRDRNGRHMPRVGIFRTTSATSANESNMDSLELALQDTSKTSSSSTNSTASHSQSPQRSPGRTGIHRNTPNTPERFEDEHELAFYHKQSESPKTRSPKYDKFIQRMERTDTWPATGWSPAYGSGFNEDTNSSPGRAIIPASVPLASGGSPLVTSSVSISTPSSNPFDEISERGVHEILPPSNLSTDHRGKYPSNHGIAAVAEEPQPSGNSNSNNEINTSQPSSGSIREDPLNPLGLHQLCEEATAPTDIAWRNALYLLGMQPELAQQLDSQGRTPLHVACTGHTFEEDHSPRPPPDFMLRALLMAHPAAIQQTDYDSRLPIHCMAATSGDGDSLQLLVEAHPASIVARDAMGWTPLHLFLQNPHIHVTVPPIQILLGMTLPLPITSSPEMPQEPIRRRRGDHLRLNVEHLDHMRRNPPEQPRWQPIQRGRLPEPNILGAYPEDVRVCLQRLAQWGRKQHRRQHKEQEQKKDTSFLSTSTFSSKTPEQERNPATMAAPQDRQLPLHIIILRGLLDVHLQCGRIEEPRRRSSKSNSLPAAQQQPKQQHTLIVIVRLLISAYPEGLIARDVNGHTPLLLAMVAVSDVLPSQELLELLLGKRTAGFESMPFWAEDVPFPTQHAYTNHKRLAPAAERYCNPAIVSTLDTCQLPLHIAAEEWGDRTSLLVAIYESYPGAIHVQDARGRMPLHILLHNYRRITPHPEVVAIFVSGQAARTRNDEGQLPFDLLVAAAPYLPKDPIRCSILPSGTVAHPDPYRAFQHFFQPSILSSKAAGGNGKNNLQRRAEAEVFLWRLRSLPPWLRRQACTASFVRELLLEELAGPAKCAFVMAQGLILALLFAAFRVQMDVFIETAPQNSNTPTFTNDASSTPSFFEGNGEYFFSEPYLRYEPWNTLAVYGLSAAGIGFQAVFWALSGSLNEFQHLCLFNIWRWVDFVAISATVATAVMIHEGIPDEHVLIMASVATGLLWCTVVGFLSNWWYSMAFFTGTMVKIVQMVVWPALLAAICVVGFAEMFYTIAQADCSQALGPISICSLRDSYQLLYFLVSGEPVIDIGAPPLSLGMTVLLVLFMALSFLLLLSVLAVVVVVASKSDSETVALEAFWEPKLAFVLSSQNSRSAAARYKKDMWIPRPSRMDGFVAQLEETWGVSVCLLFGVGKERYWYATNMSPLVKLCFRAALVVLVPLWLLAGLLTLGVLWPSQVRRFIFRPRLSLPGDVKRNEAREFFAAQVAGIRNDVMKLKGMSYEQSNDIHQELQQLKAMVATALND